MAGDGNGSSQLNISHPQVTAQRFHLEAEVVQRSCCLAIQTQIPPISGFILEKERESEVKMPVICSCSQIVH